MTFRAPAMSAQEFELLREVLQRVSGMRFPPDRAFLLENRIRPRLIATGCGSYLDYYHLIKYGDGIEMLHALDAVTNNETYFLRERTQLEATVLLASRARSPFRILSAGCASGEEPFSLALLLAEAGLPQADVGIEIVGIDLSQRMLRKAEEARFGPNSFRGVNDSYKARYFTCEGDEFVLAERLRAQVRFHRLNLMRDDIAGLGCFDVVLCRNVIIYYDQSTKETVINRLASLLRPEGVLFLGHSESVHAMEHDLEISNVNGAIGYRRRDDAPARGCAARSA